MPFAAAYRALFEVVADESDDVVEDDSAVLQGEAKPWPSLWLLDLREQQEACQQRHFVLGEKMK